MRRASIVSVLMAMASACSDGSAPSAATSPAPTAAEIKVGLFRDGHIEINGRATKLTEVPAALEAAKGDSVAYYREGAAGEPSGEQKAAIEPLLDAVMNTSLPIRLSSKPDFSDSVDLKGRSNTP
jgi:hypothetical protein